MPIKSSMVWGSILILVLAMNSCNSQKPDFQLTSTAFDEGQPIPPQYTCEGENVSPLLKWVHPPKGTATFALICDDPDAPRGTWVHWVIYDIPPSVSMLIEDIPDLPQMKDGIKQGKNDFKLFGYGGPCPPPGKPHRYFFKLYALDSVSGLEAGATKEELVKAMEGHILGEAQLMGTFKR